MTAKLQFVGPGYVIRCQPCNYRVGHFMDQAEAERIRLRHNREKHGARG